MHDLRVMTPARPVWPGCVMSKCPARTSRMISVIWNRPSVIAGRMSERRPDAVSNPVGQPKTVTTSPRPKEGSQPRFTIPELVEDLNRATRYIRAHAKDYKIDPDQIAGWGYSAGAIW